MGDGSPCVLKLWLRNSQQLCWGHLWAMAQICEKWKDRGKWLYAILILWWRHFTVGLLVKTVWGMQAIDNWTLAVYSNSSVSHSC
jgi:hypothetical protein